MSYMDDEFPTDFFNEGLGREFAEDIRLERVKFLHSPLMKFIGVLPALIVAIAIANLLGVQGNMFAFASVFTLTFIVWLKGVGVWRGVYGRAVVEGFLRDAGGSGNRGTA